MGKYIDTSAVLQVIGNIFTDVSLLDDEKYHFNEEDFPENFHKILFGAMYNLHNLGAEKVDVNVIEDYLINYPKQYSIYQSQKGAEYLTTLAQQAERSTFQYYYDRMKKMTLLRMYSERCGMDLSWLYNPDEIFNASKKQSQEEWFDNTSLEEMADLINSKIEDIKLTFVDNATDSATQAGVGAYELYQQLKQVPEIGYPLYGPLINTVTRGARLKKLYLRSSSTGVGKALPNSMKIPTPQGFRYVGEIQQDDYLYGSDGKPTKVLAVYPQENRLREFKIILKDGREISCCENHLWKIQRVVDREFQEDVQETQEIIRMINRKEKVYLPINGCTQNEDKEFDIPPAALGYLLAINFSVQGKKLLLNYSDRKMEQKTIKFLKLMGYKAYNVDISGPPRWIDFEEDSPLDKFFKKYPSLEKDKVIPDEYFFGSEAQRSSLLETLNNYAVRLLKDRTEEKKNIGATILITGTHFTRSIARLLYSLGYCRNRKTTDIFSKETKYIQIAKIERTNAVSAMTCFTVDAEDHCYLAKDFVVTHNTRTMIANVCNFACDSLYDEKQKKYAPNGTKEPALFITTEQEADEIQTMMLAFISNVEEEHILSGRYEDDEEERVIQAIKILQDAPLYIQELPDFSLQDIENCIKRGVHDYGVRYVLFDYLHTSMKILSEVSSKAGVKGLREDNVLFMIAIRLKDLCNQYGIFLMTATQLNGMYQSADVYDQNLLRGAKAVGDKIDEGEIMLEASESDKEALLPIVNQKGFPMPTIKIAVYKNRRSRYKNIILWCEDRRGVCKITPLFATDYQYKLIDIPDLKINVTPPKEEMAIKYDL